MKEYAAEVGREDLPEIVLGGLTSPGEKVDNQELIDRIGRFAEMGVTTAAITVNGRTRAEFCDEAERIGAEIIAKIDRREPA
jgi:hypothetical protein